MHRCSGTVSKVTNAQEPQVFSGDDMPSIIDQLIRLEPLFHHPELGTSYDAFDAQTTDDFWEVGASGQSTAASTSGQFSRSGTPGTMTTPGRRASSSAVSCRWTPTS